MVVERLLHFYSKYLFNQINHQFNSFLRLLKDFLVWEEVFLVRF